MKFVSTRNPDRQQTLREAVMEGLAGDGGLFMPEEIPEFPNDWWQTLSQKDDLQIAAELLLPYLESEFSRDEVHDIAKKALTFPLPLHQLDAHTHILELFHGPTLAFKDVGARFLAAVMERLMKRENNEITILTATSGDTGSAVAQAFYGSERIRVMVLYPEGKVSKVQEKQIATLGGNITALEVQGTFDDCQRMVKEAFNNPELRKHHRLTSANSINILRLLPQMIYYVLACRDLARNNPEIKPVFSVPSGNFGNLTAGLIASKMGMPSETFIAACNANHVFPDFLQTGSYQPHPSVATLSNAMDVGDPSNFERMQHLFHHDPVAFRRILCSKSYDDEATMKAISHTHHKFGYIADPHTAVGLAAWNEYFPGDQKATGIVLSTAHPAKFGNSVKQAIGAEPEIPERLARHLEAEKQSRKISNSSGELSKFLEKV